MTSPSIAMIGAGHMGSSLISGLIRNGHPSQQLWATDSNPEKLEELKTRYNIQTTVSNIEAVKAVDVVVFAIKPQMFAEVATDLASIIQSHKPLILSIAAGVRESSIQQWLGGNVSIVRAMPNMPAMIGCGAAALYANPFVSDEQHSIAESILRAVGLAVWLSDENLMDAVTALSGSGPAYFFLIMEALQSAAEQLGLPADTARLLTMQTALGAARMSMESDQTLAELRHSVTSPGGTTEKAISVLEKNKIQKILEEALCAAAQRSKELALHNAKS